MEYLGESYSGGSVSYLYMAWRCGVGLDVEGVTSLESQESESGKSDLLQRSDNL